MPGTEVLLPRARDTIEDKSRRDHDPRLKAQVRLFYRNVQQLEFVADVQGQFGRCQWQRDRLIELSDGTSLKIGDHLRERRLAELGANCATHLIADRVTDGLVNGPAQQGINAAAQLLIQAQFF